MKQQSNQIKILVDEYLQELRDRNYCAGSIWTYGKICRLFLEWCENSKIREFNETVARTYCNEAAGGFTLKDTMTANQKHTVRVVRMLLNFQDSREFEVRTPFKEYIFKTSLSKYIDSFLSFCLHVRKLCNSSIEERKRCLHKFDNYLYDKGVDLNDMNITLLEDYFSGLTKHQRRYVKDYLRGLFNYLYDTSILDKNYSKYILKEPKIRLKTELPSTYSTDEIKKIIESVNRSTAKGKRDYLILLLASEYGLRASDITSLRLKDIDWDNNKINIYQVKTGTPISLPLLASVGNAIIDYLKYGRPIVNEDIIIVQHENAYKGKKLSSPTIHSIVTSAIKNANIQNWKERKHGPHALRHSLASNMLKKGVSLPIISTVLGHTSVETTKVYISVDIEKLRLCSLPIPPIHSQYFRKETTK